jgi:hypothetical protein
VDQVSVQWWEPKGHVTQIYWKFQRPVQDVAGYIYFTDHRVLAISLLTVGSLTLSDALSRLGEPTSLWARVKEEGNRRWCELDLAAPKKGFLLRVDIDIDSPSQPLTVELSLGMPVYRVVYFDSAKYPDASLLYILFHELSPSIVERARPWAGAGRYPCQP